jgi:NADPH:quinone reductase
MPHRPPLKDRRRTPAARVGFKCIERIVDRVEAFARAPQAGIQLLGGGPGADPGTEIRAAARLELARLAQDGTLRVFVTQTFPLADVAAAHRAIMTGHTTGKIALIP